MSKFTDNISLLQDNVFSLTPIFISFYKNYKSRDYDLLLSYLLLPLVLNPVCVEELKILSSKSRLTRIVTKKEIMAGFSERIEYYNQITNDCLQYAVDCKYIKIQENLSVNVINQDCLFTDLSLNRAINLASNLPKVFNLDVINIYYAFGIKGL